MASERIEFPGSQGPPLAGRLDRPETPPRGWARRPCTPSPSSRWTRPTTCWSARPTRVLPPASSPPGRARYVADDAAATGAVHVTERGTGAQAVAISAGRHALLADEPVAVGGDDAGPNPYQMLSAALGSCTAMTLRMYANRKQWPLERVSVTLHHAKVHAADCAECETHAGRVDRIDRRIRMEGTLDAARRQRLLEIADKCPVHRTLHSEVQVVTREDSAPSP